MGNTAIPIDDIVTMLPGVIGATGTPGRLTGLVVTEDSSILPVQLGDFFNATDVLNWFGSGSPESIIANNYFPGVVNGGQLPYDLKFVRYVSTAIGAAEYGASLGTLTLAELQALSGSLTITTATAHTAASISLSAATSFADAASIIEAAFTSPDFTVEYDALRNRFTVTTTLTGPTAAMSDASGTLAPLIGLTVASGATLQGVGVAADTPASAMARAVGLSTNWASFGLAYQETLSNRLAYAQWNSGQKFKYWFVAADTDAASITPNNSASFGAQVFAIPYQGTTPLYGSYAEIGGLMGYAAAINFNIANGRSNLMFRQFVSGIAPLVTTEAVSQALKSNNYTFIGGYANAANTWTIAVNGSVSGEFLWVDTYLDQIYLNAQLQMAWFTALLAYGSVPYNADGYNDLYRAAKDVVQAALTAGIIRAGVTLSQSEIQQINNAAGGVDAATVIQTRGWYLLITDPANPVQARTTRTSPQVTLWYTDGGSIQQITAGSNAVI